MLSRENFHLVKFLIFLWSRNTSRDTQSVETGNAFILPRWNTSQLILAKIGVPSDGENPVERNRAKKGGGDLVRERRPKFKSG